jgi:excisionase family DNA binding protein
MSSHVAIVVNSRGIMNQVDWEQLLASYPAVLTIDEVAAIVRVHPRSVQRWIHAGQLVALRVGRSYRIAKADLLAWIAAAQRPSVPAPGPGVDAHANALVPQMLQEP